jgi:histidinol dehydrogenase
MKTYINPNKSKWQEILKRPAEDSKDMENIVRNIFQSVRNEGDLAIRKFTQKFDNVRLESIKVNSEETKDALKKCNDELIIAIKKAAANIRKFHSAQITNSKVIETMPGVQCWQKSTAIEKVGLYIPGGTAPLFSTVLMLAIPAKIAGCKEIVLCTPPNKQGKVHPAIIAAANIVGVDKIYKAGGIQAIAALTFGTESIPPVNKIFGPGNQYVTAAKQYAEKFGLAIDLPAGPSEVMVVADDSAKAEFIAADLLSQAEHGADSQVIFLSLSRNLINEVEGELLKQLDKLPRKEIAIAALANSKTIFIESNKIAIELINEYAPEHLILSVADEIFFEDKVINAGSVFLGNYTPESAGDYASGTNHTLPTNGYAKVYSGVSLDSFVKKITFQKISRRGLEQIGPIIEIMATEEELDAHKNAVSIRLEQLKSNKND